MFPLDEDTIERIRQRARQQYPSPTEPPQPPEPEVAPLQFPSVEAMQVWQSPEFISYIQQQRIQREVAAMEDVTEKIVPTRGDRLYLTANGEITADKRGFPLYYDPNRRENPLTLEKTSIPAVYGMVGEAFGPESAEIPISTGQRGRIGTAGLANLQEALQEELLQQTSVTPSEALAAGREELLTPGMTPTEARAAGRPEGTGSQIETIQNVPFIEPTGEDPDQVWLQDKEGLPFQFPTVGNWLERKIIYPVTKVFDQSTLSIVERSGTGSQMQETLKLINGVGRLIGDVFSLGWDMVGKGLLVKGSVGPWETIKVHQASGRVLTDEEALALEQQGEIVEEKNVVHHRFAQLGETWSRIWSDLLPSAIHPEKASNFPDDIEALRQYAESLEEGEEFNLTEAQRELGIPSIEELENQIERTKQQAYRHLQMTGDIEGAADLMIQAHKDQETYWKRTQFLVPSLTWTFFGDDERQEAFHRAWAQAELQYGHELTPIQIQRLTWQFSDPWSELAGGMIFDLTNFLPIGAIANFGLDIIKLPFKGAGKVGVFATEEVAKKGADAFIGWRLLDWFRSESTLSAAKSLGFDARNASHHIARSVDLSISAPGTVTAVGGGTPTSFQDMVELTYRAIVLDDAEAFARLPVGFQRRGFRTFLKLADMYDEDLAKSSQRFRALKNINPENWGQLVEDSRNVVFQTKYDMELARLLSEGVSSPEAERIAKELAEDFASKPQAVIAEFSSNFQRAFLELHTPHVRLGALDDHILIEFAERVGFKWEDHPHWQTAVHGLMAVSNAVRNLWTSLVLPLRPAWIAYNLVDSTFRYMVAGGRMFDDIGTLLKTNWSKVLRDEYLPAEVTSTFGRTIREIGSTRPVEREVAERFFRGWKPKYSIASFISEAARLEKKALGPADTLFEKLTNPIRIGWAGLTDGPGDFQAAIELTLRTHLIHQQYSKAFTQLDSWELVNFIGRLRQTGVSEDAIAAIKQAWNYSYDNPDAFKQALQRLMGEGKPGGKVFSLLLPENLDELVQGAGIARKDRDLIIRPLLESIEEHLQFYSARGKSRPQLIEEIQAFFDGVERGLWDEFIARNEDEVLQGMRGHPVGQAAETVEEASRAAQRPVDTGVTVTRRIFRRREAEVPTQALDSLREAGNARSKLESYRDVIAPIADVGEDRALEGLYQVAVEGDQVRVTFNPRILREAADDVDDVLIRATGDLLQQVDDEAIRTSGLFEDVNYTIRLERYLDDPDAFRSANPEMAEFFELQMGSNPDARRLLEALTGEDLKFTDELGQVSDDISDVIGASIDDDDLVIQGNKRYMVSQANRESGLLLSRDYAQTYSAARGWRETAEQLRSRAKTIRGADPDQADKLLEEAIQWSNRADNLSRAVDNLHRMKDRFNRFLVEEFPGPVRKSGLHRQLAWDTWDTMDVYAEDQIRRWLQELVRTELDEPVEITLREFLQRAGIDVDVAGNQVTGLTITAPGVPRIFRRTGLPSSIRNGLIRQIFGDAALKFDFGRLMDAPFSELTDDIADWARGFTEEVTTRRAVRTTEAIVEEVAEEAAEEAAERVIITPPPRAELQAHLPQGQELAPVEVFDRAGETELGIFQRVRSTSDDELPELVSQIDDFYSGDRITSFREQRLAQVAEARYIEMLDALDEEGLIQWAVDLGLDPDTEQLYDRILAAQMEAFYDNADLMESLDDLEQYVQFFAGDQFNEMYRSVDDWSRALSESMDPVQLRDHIYRHAHAQLTQNPELTDEIINHFNSLFDLDPEELGTDFNIITDVQMRAYLSQPVQDLDDPVLRAGVQAEAQWMQADLDGVHYDTNTSLTPLFDNERRLRAHADTFISRPEWYDEFAQQYRMPSVRLRERLNEALQHIIDGTESDSLQVRRMTERLREVVAQNMTDGAYYRELAYDAAGNRSERLVLSRPPVPHIAEQMGAPAEEIDEFVRLWENLGVDNADTLLTRVPDDPLADEYSRMWRAMVEGQQIPGLEEMPRQAQRSPTSMRRALESFMEEAEARGALPDNARAVLEQTIEELRYKEYVLKQHLSRQGLLPGPEVISPNYRLTPPFPTWEMPHYWQTWLFSNRQNLARMQAAFDLLAKLRRHTIDLVSSGDDFLLRRLAQEDVDILRNIIDDMAASKARSAEVAMSGSDEALEALGGQPYEGALNITQRHMLDYNHYNRVDSIMRQFIPFWKFPRESLPFWMNTMAEKPWIVSFYSKYLRFSAQQSIQRGATTRDGRQLPSLQGYVPIPGTGLWWNPTAALSFRYVIPDMDRYETDFPNDMSLSQVALNYIFEFGRIYGLNFAPWITIPLYAGGKIDPNRITPWSPVPQMSLIPVWWQRWMQEKINQSIFPDMPWLWTPEVGWKDYLVERQLLVNLLQYIQSTPNRGDQVARAQEVREALGYIRDPNDPKGYRISPREDHPLWEEARRQVELSNYYRSTAGYFTGMYTKEYTDAQAELYRLRDEINFHRDMVNNEIGASIFSLDPDASKRYDYYIDRRYNQSDSYVWSLYGNIGFVRTPEGDPAYGDQRRDLIIQEIHRDTVTREYYNALESLNGWLDTQLEAMPIGAESEVIYDLYQEYFARRKQLDEDPQYDVARRPWLIGHKPAEDIQDHFEDMWWRYLEETRPRWHRNEGETYDQWQTRLEEWERLLPDTAAALSSQFLLEEVQPLGGEITANRIFLPQEMVQTLLDGTTPEAYAAWRKSKDTMYDALSEAWETLYLDTYWAAIDSVPRNDPAYGELREMVERDWYQRNQTPPSTEELIAWVMREYPERWTEEELIKAIQGREVLPIEARLEGDQTEVQQIFDQIWEYLFMVGPGQNFTEFRKEFLRLGGDEDLLTAWYETDGHIAYIEDEDTQENFQAFAAKIEETILSLNLTEPTREELLERVEVKRLNDEFRRGITAELGGDFYSTLAYYANLGRDDKKEWRKSNPELYEKIQQYYEMKDFFAGENPLWAKYYHPTFEPTTTTPRGGYVRRSRRRGGGRPSSTVEEPTFIPVGYRGTLDADRLLTMELGKGGVNRRPWWPPGFIQVAGPEIVREAEKRITHGDPVSKPGQDYLQGLKKRHPEYKDFINYILSPAGGGGPYLAK